MKSRPAAPPLTSPAAASWRPMLTARPVQNAAATVRELGGNTLQLTVRKRAPRWLVPPLTWWIKPRLTTCFELDELGTKVWQLCDGRRTVEDIIDVIAADLQLSFHESRVAVTNYMKLLVQRGVLVVTMPAAASDADGAAAAHFEHATVPPGGR